ncbi:RNA polymerase II C-terminal domain phosphatase-like 4 [Melia azedarach]|uniref:RNA polymerase II C-terminal domain phosphatase-like 4 n=1 Tax=Melia azedarach TaxID=155640 RepID=A0ACC1YCZ8_MELAZ|nr:RNA polymerase II C-terminal domain phosphatase-like 4 [Melia azedarach]
MVVAGKNSCERKRRFHQFVLALKRHWKPFLASKQTCMHNTVLKGICIRCKKAVDNSHGSSFDFLLEGLRFSDNAVYLLKQRHTETLLKKRKLLLVLDLDHTLVHCLKLRPYAQSFLEEASKMFEMHLCTIGSRLYAQKATKFLDPNSKYFSCRIIAFEDFERKASKNLNLVLGEERSIIIVDDTENVWGRHTENLITVSRYDYFTHKGGVDKSYSEEKTDESESNGGLANILRVLKTVHGLFFDNSTNGDVPSLLAKIRGGILTGCTLLFRDVHQDLPLMKSKAELMGATCTTEIDSSMIITHVVSSNAAKAEESRRAEQENLFLVHPKWIEAAYFLWSRQPEQDYSP